MNAPLVSVCVITYNHEPFIRNCLDGILQQKVNFPIEIIIGEDCSKDGTRSIIEEYVDKYPDLFVPIFHNKNVGGARNGYEHCFNKIRGKYVAVCEGDDFWTNADKLQKQVDFLEAHPEFSFCFHRIDAVNEKNEKLEAQDTFDRVKVYSPEEVIHTFIPTLSVVFKHNFTRIPEEIYSVKSADAFLFAMLAKFGPGADLGFMGASYRKHSGGVFNSLSKYKQLQQAIETRRTMLKSEFFDKRIKNEIKRDIFTRKKKGFLLLLKEFKLSEIPSLLTL
ncbi:MAG: glycosyltransferase [Chitinophagaceae bacterium]|nr:glycosyltransferase [Chitinophagaceae bacterium]